MVKIKLNKKQISDYLSKERNLKLISELNFDEIITVEDTDNQQKYFLKVITIQQDDNSIHNEQTLKLSQDIESFIQNANKNIDGHYFIPQLIDTFRTEDQFFIQMKLSELDLHQKMKQLEILPVNLQHHLFFHLMSESIERYQFFFSEINSMLINIINHNNLTKDDLDTDSKLNIKQTVFPIQKFQRLEEVAQNMIYWIFQSFPNIISYLFSNDNLVDPIIGPISVQELSSQSFQEIIGVFNRFKKFNWSAELANEIYQEYLKNSNGNSPDVKINLLRLCKQIQPQNREYTIELANALFGKNQFYESIKEYEEYCALDPNSLICFYKLGQAYDKIVHKQQAIASFKKCLELNTTFDLALKSLGLIYTKEENFEEAIQMYSNCVQLQPDDEESISQLGNIFVQLQQFDKAILHLKRCIEINPNNDNHYLELAKAYWIEGQTKENAIKSFERCLEINSLNANCFIYLRDNCLTKEIVTMIIELLKKNENINETFLKETILLTDSFITSKKLQESIQLLEQLLELQHISTEILLTIYSKIGQVYYLLEDYQNSLKWYYKWSDVSQKVDEDILVCQGKVYKRLKEYEEAIQKFKQCLELNPKNKEASIELDNILYFQNEFNEVIEKYKNCKDMYHYKSTYYFETGVQHYQNYRLDDAQTAFEAYLEQIPDHFDSVDETADNIQKKGQSDQLLTVYKYLVEIKPKEEKFLLALGLYYQFFGFYKEAITQFLMFTKLGYTSAKCYYYLGLAYAKNGQDDEAIEILKKHSDAYPDYYQFHCCLAILYSKKRDYNQVIEQCLFCLNKDSKDVRCLNRLIILYKYQEKFEDGLKALLKRIEIKPELQSNQIDFEELWEKVKHTETKSQVLISLKKLSQNNLSSQYCIAIIHFIDGRYEESILRLQKCIYLDPKNYLSYKKLGECLQKKNQLDEAFNNYKIALSLQPDCKFCQQNLGFLLQCKGQLDEAIEYYLKSQSPDYYLHRVNLPIIYHQKGLYKKSWKYLKKIFIYKGYHYYYILELLNYQYGLPEEFNTIYSKRYGIERTSESKSFCSETEDGKRKLYADMDQYIDQYTKSLGFVKLDLEFCYYTFGLVIYHYFSTTIGIQWIQKALEINPKNEETYLQLGIFQYNTNELEALKSLKMSYSLNPSNYNTNLRLGSYYAEHEMKNRAILYYKKCIEINPMKKQVYSFFSRSFGIDEISLEKQIKNIKKLSELDHTSYEILNLQIYKQQI